jgi:hypothetical protein
MILSLIQVNLIISQTIPANRAINSFGLRQKCTSRNQRGRGPLPTFFGICAFFKQQDWLDSEAMKFYNYYNGINWRIGGRIRIED